MVVLTSGQPIAWCISDREDATVVEAFLQAVKDRAKACRLRVVMTDDGKNSIIIKHH